MPSKIYNNTVMQTFLLLLDATKTPLASLLSTFHDKLIDNKNKNKKTKYKAHLLQFLVDNQQERITKKHLEHGKTRKTLLEIHMTFLADKLPELRRLSFRGLAILLYTEGEKQSRTWKTTTFRREFPQAHKEIERQFKEITTETEKKEKQILEEETKAKAVEAEKHRLVEEEKLKVREAEKIEEEKNEEKAKVLPGVKVDQRRTSVEDEEKAVQFERSEEQRVMDIQNSGEISQESIPVADEKESQSNTRDQLNLKTSKFSKPTRNGGFQNLSGSAEPENRLRFGTTANANFGNQIEQRKDSSFADAALMRATDEQQQTKGPFTLHDLVDQEFKVEVTVKIRPVKK